MEARLAKAKEAGYIEEDEFASLTLTQVETYLARIAKLESENRRLKQVDYWAVAGSMSELIMLGKGKPEERGGMEGKSCIFSPRLILRGWAI